jgi:hypothetical protein
MNNKLAGALKLGLLFFTRKNRLRFVVFIENLFAEGWD